MNSGFYKVSQVATILNIQARHVRIILATGAIAGVAKKNNPHAPWAVPIDFKVDLEKVFGKTNTYYTAQIIVKKIPKERIL